MLAKTATTQQRYKRKKALRDHHKAHTFSNNQPHLHVRGLREQSPYELKNKITQTRHAELREDRDNTATHKPPKTFRYRHKAPHHSLSFVTTCTFAVFASKAPTKKSQRIAPLTALQQAQGIEPVETASKAPTKKT